MTLLNKHLSFDEMPIQCLIWVFIKRHFHAPLTEKHKTRKKVYESKNCWGWSDSLWFQSKKSSVKQVFPSWITLDHGLEYAGSPNPKGYKAVTATHRLRTHFIDRLLRHSGRLVGQFATAKAQGFTILCFCCMDILYITLIILCWIEILFID